MKHLKVFETVVAFEAAKEQLESPYVALTEDNEKVQYEKSEEPQPTYEYVDLGLPSGLKWATMNVGATSETDLGTKFAWGETETKDEFTCENYKYYEPYNTYYWQGTKYCQADGLTTLEQQDDAAHVHMGGNWRMPTKDEIQELLDYTNSEYVTQDDVTYVRMASKTDSSKYIIFPTDVYDSYGQRAQLWSSTVKIDNTSMNAFDLTITQYYGLPYLSKCPRYLGSYVRGVLDA